MTQVYLSSRRLGGNFQLYLSFFDDTQVFFNFIPEVCINEARKILCHYYLPTCGNSTTFEPPTSVCRDVCEYLWSLCPEVYEEFSRFFESNELRLSPIGLTMINCSNTGDYINPLHHCCTDLDIAIRKFQHCVSQHRNLSPSQPAER